jgi:hypothetical protein
MEPMHLLVKFLRGLKPKTSIELELQELEEEMHP